jgi:hypothetical protein
MFGEEAFECRHIASVDRGNGFAEESVEGLSVRRRCHAHSIHEFEGDVNP